LSEKAYFFQGDTLLLPVDFLPSQIEELPLELIKNFDIDKIDVFEVQALDCDAAICTVNVLSETALPENWKAIPVRQTLAITSFNPGRMLRAFHVAKWRQESRFCGTCGAKNIDVPDTAERKCPNCGRSEFPRICPAVITAITDDENRILLAHNKKFRAGMYSLVSGFNEAGETLEETVVREIREEVNIEVKDIVYVKSQPWPFPNSLMLGFTARYSSGTLRPDGVEIEDAGWYTADNLPDIPAEGSLSRFLINRWLDGLSQQHS